MMQAVNTINDRFRLALIHLLAQRGLDPAALAQMTGLSPETLEEALRGQSALDTSAQVELARVLGLEYDEALALGRRLETDPATHGDHPGTPTRDLAVYLSRMLTVASSFRVADNAEDLYQRITQALCRHLPFRRAMLFLLEGGKMVLHSLSWEGGDAEGLARALRAEPAPLDPLSVEYETFALGRALPVEVGQSDFFPPAARALLGERTEVALAPLFTDREFIGVVEADFAGEPGWRLGEGDLTGLETFATLSGTLLYNVWLYAELETKNRELQIRVRELTLVGEMTRVLNRSLSPEATARHMLSLLVQTMGAEQGFLFLYDAQAEELRLFAGHELPPGLLEGGEVIGGVSPTDLQGAAQGQAALLPGLTGPRVLRPLMSRDRYVGLWGLARGPEGEPFNALDQQVLATADEQVSVALTSMRLRLMASTDLLTGLYTRGHFLEALDQELKVGRYLGHAVSLILIDADLFKNVNDLHGHLGGDAVLASLGQALRLGTRRTDVAARIGGEEFAVLLPRCDQAQAQAVAEKLRAGVENNVVHHQGREIRLTISLGVASQEAGEAVDRDDLLNRADQALYRAKRQGRNRVCLHDPELDRSAWGSVAEEEG
jgi:diguanylate cyclase (GGDEF)-like protein